MYYYGDMFIEFLLSLVMFIFEWLGYGYYW